MKVNLTRMEWMCTTNPTASILYARKELAFKRWQDSGYTDLEQHKLFLEYYHELNAMVGSYRT